MLQQRRLLAGVAFSILAIVGSASRNAYADGAGAVSATDAAPVTAEASADSEDIVVFGRGQTRQQSSISGDVITLQAPGISPLKAIERLPGVSFQSADAFGAYEWSARITLRSFNQNQLGFTLDGVPLGDMSYGNYNGLHISRAVIAENLSRVDVAEGAGALATASTSNLGGAIEFTQRRPGDVFGVDGALTAGSNSDERGFVRLDTGSLLGSDSFRASVSYVYQDENKWKGDGEQKQQQANASFVQPIPRGEISGFLNWSHRRENDYQDLSLNMIDRLGYDWDNNSGDWPGALQVADAYQNPANYAGATPVLNGAGCWTGAGANPYPAPISCVDDAYFNAAGLRNDTIGALKVVDDLTDALHVSLMYYRHENEGQGLWYTPYVPTPAGALGQGGQVIADPAPISVRTTEYDIQRYGFIGSATLDLGPHAITGGFWYENNDFNQARRFYGLSRGSIGRDSLEFQEHPFFTQWEYAFNTETKQFYLQDVWTVTDALTVSAGFKSTDVQNSARTIVGDDKTGDIDAKDNFLPQAGLTYDLSNDHQLFINYAENMRAFVSAGTAGPFSTSADGFAAIKDTLKPETSRTWEAGWRFQFDTLRGSLAVYHVDFKNRLLSVSLGPGIVGAPSALQNVGGVQSEGLELAGQWQFAPNWSLFGSYSYNHSTYQDDVFDSATPPNLIAATDGKTTVDTPRNLFRANLSYDNGSLFGSLGLAYTDKRYFTYLNDQSVDSYTLLDLTAGYRFHDTGSALLDGTEVQLNVANLTDEDYISTIGSNGFGNSGDAQTVLAGSPREAFVTIRRHF